MFEPSFVVGVWHALLIPVIEFRLVVPWRVLGDRATDFASLALLSIQGPL